MTRPLKDITWVLWLEKDIGDWRPIMEAKTYCGWWSAKSFLRERMKETGYSRSSWAVVKKGQKPNEARKPTP